MSYFGFLNMGNLLLLLPSPPHPSLMDSRSGCSPAPLVWRYQCLRTFAPIVSAHPYCARKFTCHVMHQARPLSAKMNNDRADGHCYSVAWIYDLGRSVTPTFLFRNRFYLQLSPHCQKKKKKSMWEVKKIQLRFLSTGHGILPSWGCKTRETMVAKCKLVLWGTSPVK